MRNYLAKLERNILNNRIMTDLKMLMEIAAEYASQYFDKEKEEDKWSIVRNAWLSGWHKHRLYIQKCNKI